MRRRTPPHFWYTLIRLKRYRTEKEVQWCS
nr:MAG TPA: hypothetical protein [Caudoviricetes sp.]